MGERWCRRHQKECISCGRKAGCMVLILNGIKTNLTHIKHGSISPCIYKNHTTSRWLRKCPPLFILPRGGDVLSLTANNLPIPVNFSKRNPQTIPPGLAESLSLHHEIQIDFLLHSASGIFREFSDRKID